MFVFMISDVQIQSKLLLENPAGLELDWKEQLKFFNTTIYADWFCTPNCTMGQRRLKTL